VLLLHAGLDGLDNLTVHCRCLARLKLSLEGAVLGPGLGNFRGEALDYFPLLGEKLQRV
jgi:hypothetical protein